MPDSVGPVDFELALTLNDEAPRELQIIGEQYWELDGIEEYSSEIVWTRKTSEIDYKPWSGTAHYAAAAALVATSPTFECSNCGGALTLSSRQTLSDARRGLRVICRECNTTTDERAAGVLDPAARARRERKMEAERTAAQRATEAQATERARLATAAELDTARQIAIQARYPAETENDDGYTLDRTSVTTKIAALAVIHAAGQTSGLIHPVRYDDASIAPDSETARELFVDAWHSGLLIVHPSSPPSAFVWDQEDATELGNGLYADRTHFAAPGGGQLTRRLEELARSLRDALGLEKLRSTERDELRELAKLLVAEEAIRYLSFELSLHDLPNPGEQHQERLRSHAAKAASSFALGHIYKMAWTAARDAISAYKRIAGMNREKAATHGLNKFVFYIQRGLDEPDTLGATYSERTDLPLSAATDIVFRVILEFNPMTAAPSDIAGRLIGSPDQELRRACDDRVPDQSTLIEWLRTSSDWEPNDFRSALARVGTDVERCAPGCAHERATMIAYQAGQVYDRIISRIGERDAAIVTAEALSLGNKSAYESRAGDLVLASLAIELGWTPNAEPE